MTTGGDVVGTVPPAVAPVVPGPAGFATPAQTPPAPPETTPPAPPTPTQTTVPGPAPGTPITTPRVTRYVPVEGGTTVPAGRPRSAGPDTLDPLVHERHQVLTDDLLELQRIDTTTDQLAHRRAHLDERVSSNAATGRLRANRTRRAEAVARDEELERSIGGLEHDGVELTTHRTRSRRQLKTVIAPREAEALMHEIATIGERRDALDDQELAFLDEQSELAGEVARLDDALPELEAAAARGGRRRWRPPRRRSPTSWRRWPPSGPDWSPGSTPATLERYEFLRSRLRRCRRRQARRQPVQRLPPRPVAQRARRGQARRRRRVRRLPAVRPPARALTGPASDVPVVRRRRRS